LHATGARFTLEAEDFVAFNNIGEQKIQRLPLSGCSSGYILYGLDVPTEWTEYDVTIPSAGTYQFALISRGAEGESYSLKIALTKAIDPSSVTWGIVKNLYE
jgi:hypothetical protein